MTEADTIRILIATDNHVGYEERDPIRKDDSWQTFDEVMNIARTQDDPDINVAIPVFSIHGNHDDPSGDGNFCSLDLLQASGLLNYFGRIAEADNIQAKPILLQKGVTKLALFGLSNVRDERMFRTFRDHKVKWFRPGSQTGEWFNLLTVHQNHHAHTATSYLPENVLPDWMDLVVWGHEHECLIDPTRNPETGFHVIQPGSSVATSLIPGEAVRKHVAIASITGKDFKIEKIPLRSVRPFVARELVLAQEKRFKGLEKKKDNRQEVTRRLMEVVDEMIEEANADWEAIQTDEEALEDRPLPLIRLKVEYTAPEGGQFECENPQRFSNRFVGKVANINDVVYFYRKKTAQQVLNIAEGDIVKVESIVSDFLSAQSLKVLPQGPFGDAVNQFVSKDDKHAMELFVSEHLTGQVQQLLNLESDDEDLNSAMDLYRTRIEQQMASGAGSRSMPERKRILKPKPSTWDSDFDGNWEDEPDAWTYEDIAAPSFAPSTGRASRTARQSKDVNEDEDEDPLPKTTKRTSTRTEAAAKGAPVKKAATAKKTSASTRGGSRSCKAKEPSEVEEEDIVMASDDEPPAPVKKTTARQPATRAAPARAMRTRQTTLDFSESQQTGRRGAASQKAAELSDDEISDEDDAFDPPPSTVTRRSTRR
ncbi:double-strand break repair protein MRE11 [Geosmithia morbida]|uniref:Double-strand break repair protein n=1 Tax=Geosmithia morbida TaxID=1094350 RepID=A0A9P4YR92_9HYPO|nr:double-strand break repair protein MRE11 [Geosmithia morbida]KAF4119564.1 double-strand break repair protein MRE11 [Geosmithia morbida]